MRAAQRHSNRAPPAGGLEASMACLPPAGPCKHTNARSAARLLAARPSAAACCAPEQAQKERSVCMQAAWQPSSHLHCTHSFAACSQHVPTSLVNAACSPASRSLSARPVVIPTAWVPGFAAAFVLTSRYGLAPALCKEPRHQQGGGCQPVDDRVTCYAHDVAMDCLGEGGRAEGAGVGLLCG